MADHFTEGNRADVEALRKGSIAEMRKTIRREDRRGAGMIRGVIFDLDGVLATTDELHYQAWKRLAGDLGITGFHRGDNARQRGVSRMESLKVVLEKGEGRYTDEEMASLAKRKNEYYRELLEDLDETAVLPGAVETLIMLREKGILTAVGSASENAPVILAKPGLADFVDSICCGLEVTKSKPDPEVFIKAAGKLKLPNRSCLVVEDAVAGIQAARAAEMKTLAVGEDHNLLDADWSAPTLAEVAGWDAILYG